ncbi:hypothetical protein J3Q64DRAFT_1213267 [Phycomyces blakesleeanus]|uniref:Uncharacterized protein n=1 Tax=Phycomyces blakesleeanus TaxID=4837 RepID=A0ABR3B8F1_PHYBL
MAVRICVVTGMIAAAMIETVSIVSGGIADGDIVAYSRHLCMDQPNQVQELAGTADRPTMLVETTRIYVTYTRFYINTTIQSSQIQLNTIQSNQIQSNRIKYNII